MVVVRLLRREVGRIRHHARIAFLDAILIRPSLILTLTGRRVGVLEPPSVSVVRRLLLGLLLVSLPSPERPFVLSLGSFVKHERAILMGHMVLWMRLSEVRGCWLRGKVRLGRSRAGISASEAVERLEEAFAYEEAPFFAWGMKHRLRASDRRGRAR
jgi:hypothetical protein